MGSLQRSFRGERRTWSRSVRQQNHCVESSYGDHMGYGQETCLVPVRDWLISCANFQKRRQLLVALEAGCSRAKELPQRAAAFSKT